MEYHYDKWENHFAPEWELQCQETSLLEYASFWGREMEVFNEHKQHRL